MAAFDVKVEIAFDSNFTTAAADRTWTDVTTYVRHTPGVAITWGRSGALQSTEPSTLSLTLKNGDGRFTPGNTASPYYPNVKLDRPIRVTVTPDGGLPSVRFTGYVNEWPVSWPAIVDTYAEVVISATSRTGRLGLRNAMQAMVIEDAITTSAAAIYPLADPSGSAAAADVSGNDAPPLTPTGNGTPVSFNGSDVEFAVGQFLTGGSPIDLSSGVTFACTFSCTMAPIGSNPASVAQLWALCAMPPATLARFTDGHPHRFVASRSSSGPVNATVDGVAVTIPDLGTGGTVAQNAGWNFTGTLRDLVYWPSELTSGDVADDFVAFNGGYGEVSDATLQRLAGYLSIPIAEVDADPGVVVMGGIDTSGMAAVDALRVVESTEGGILVDARNGDLRLIGRRARYASTSSLTLNVATGEVSPGYSPTMDRALLRNDVTGTNAASSVGSIDAGAMISQRAINQGSVDEYGTTGSSVEVAAADAAEAYAAASWIVANFGEPSPRAPELGINMRRLAAAKQQDVLGLFIGDRFTMTNRPTQDSGPEVDFFIEGGSETWSPTDCSVVWNVSPIGLVDSIAIIDDAVLGQIDAGNYIGY